MQAENAIVFEGATADLHETTLTIIDPTGDRTINLPNQSGTIPVLAAASNTAITSTPAELNILDGVTSTAAELNILDGVTSTAAELNILDGATVVVGEINALDLGSTAVGTAIASKAVILDSNKDYTGIRNLTISGEIDAATGDFSGAVDIAGATTTAALTASGAISVDDTTDSTSGTTGSIHTDGGLGVAKEIYAGTGVTIPSGHDYNWSSTANRINYNGTAVRIFQASASVLECDGGLVTLPNTSGGLSVDGTTDTSSGTTGSIHTDGGVGVAKALYVGTTSKLIGITTHGGNVVSDADSTDDLGTTGVRWANLFVDGITATDQITATGFTGTLDGILGSGAAAAATVTTLNTTGAVTFNDAGAAVDFRVEGDADTHLIFADASSDNIVLGGSIGSQFNSVGGSAKLTVVGSSNSTAVLGNTIAAIQIVNTDTTASNTAGLHFSRADTDNSPNYAGASIVAQFGETQATGQYPSASLSFLTSTAQNSAPSLKMTLSAAGLLGIGTAAPASLLEIKAAALNRANGIALVGSGANDVLYMYPSADNVATIEHLIDGSTSTGGVLAINPQGGAVTVGSEGGAATTNVSLGLCKAWIRTSGAAVSIADSFNMTSITDSGVGLYAPVIANNMNDGNYALILGADDKQDGAGIFVHTAQDAVSQATTGYATSFKKLSVSAYSLADANQNAASSVLGDLA
jgi:hypothetical protein